ncbi:CPBP family intramembrane glutamic endopeptidase [Leptolyngbya sp. FACHB-261]|uniref:CPBP family intramembrane glutamic endopeptidase n=1 Tax=Leptolyngbya sp. FACHB-261 TaxID=2692806 RepID=UPI00168284D3|nr:type II CAAX endopeptidase family protein [Leptolyngbya sp. FACHB-261]MBD2102417.1 CPBP family intramembrane metalloprotease [Leptolyngbya sp. FACHB-261]
MANPPRKPQAWLALLLFVPVTSIGTFVNLHLAPGAIGWTVFGLGQIWVLVLPLLWLLWVEQGKPRVQLSGRGIGFGILSGLLIFGAILAAYWLIGTHWLDPAEIQAKVQQIGRLNPSTYLLSSIYWSLFNSLAEEYSWRWFVYRQFEALLPRTPAIVLSALAFTLHHIIGLAAYAEWRVVLLGSVGVFIGGALWSWSYQAYRSIWPSYISHSLADIALAIVGWQLLFAQAA